MSCPASGFGNGLEALDIDLSGGETSYYAGDRFVVTGNFDLTNSPYATNPNLIYVPGSKKSGQVVGQVGQLAFDNLFIDWGDGTVQKITAVPNDSSMTNWSRGETMNLPAPNSQSTKTLLSEGIYVHAYNNPTSYIIRVFQLSEADAQHVNASLLGASVDGPGGSPFLQAATVGKLVSLNNGSGATSQGSVGNAFQSVLVDASAPVLSKNGNASSSSGCQPPAGSRSFGDYFARLHDLLRQQNSYRAGRHGCGRAVALENHCRPGLPRPRQSTVQNSQPSAARGARQFESVKARPRPCMSRRPCHRKRLPRANRRSRSSPCVRAVAM